MPVYRKLREYFLPSTYSIHFSAIVSYLKLLDAPVTTPHCGMQEVVVATVRRVFDISIEARTAILALAPEGGAYALVRCAGRPGLSANAGWQEFPAEWADDLRLTSEALIRESSAAAVGSVPKLYPLPKLNWYLPRRRSHNFDRG